MVRWPSLRPFQSKAPKFLPIVFYQASVELAPTYAALILADDGIEITVSPAKDLLIKISYLLV